MMIELITDYQILYLAGKTMELTKVDRTAVSTALRFTECNIFFKRYRIETEGKCCDKHVA